MNVDPSNLTGQIIFGQYEIKEQIGKGGFAYVYKGRDSQLKRDVAIKVINEKYANQETYIEQFIQEGRFAANAAEESQHIVKIYKGGKDETIGLPFLVMEYIDGKSLQKYQYLENLETNSRLRLASELVVAIWSIHKANIYHGDITPNNILIREQGPDNTATATIIDFGLSWDLTGDIPEERRGGTLSYMAPEYLQGKIPHEVSDRKQGDIFSLSATLYFLLKGEHFFPELREAESEYYRRNSLSTVSAYARELSPIYDTFKYHPIQLNDLSVEINKELNSILESGLSGDPNERPKTIDIHDTFIGFSNEAVQTKRVGAKHTTTIPNYSLITYLQEKTDRIITRTIFKRESHGKYYVQLENQSPTPSQYDLIVMGNNPNHVVLNKRIIQVPKGLFRIWLEITNEEVQLSVSSGMGKILKKEGDIVVDEIHEMFDEQAISSSRIRLIFILDRQLYTDNHIEKIWYSIEASLNKLGDLFKFEVSAIVYDQHQSLPPYCKLSNEKLTPVIHKNRWHSTVDMLKTDLEEVFDVGTNNENKGICGCMELALARAYEFLQQHTDALPKEHQHVIVIGSSPYHPTPHKREKYELLDWTYDEFKGNQNPEHIISNLKEIANLDAYYANPLYRLMPTEKEFIEHVWRQLSHTNQFNQFVGDFNQLADQIVDLIRNSYPSWLESHQYKLPKSME